MRILSELIGGTVLLLIFAWGVRETIRFFATREKKDVNAQQHDSDEPADRASRH